MTQDKKEAATAPTVTAQPQASVDALQLQPHSTPSHIARQDPIVDQAQLYAHPKEVA